MNRPNIILGASAIACVIAGGGLLAVTEHQPFGSSLCTSLATATTSGCPSSAPVAAQAVAAGLMLLAIPLLGALFGRLTAQHASRKVHEHIAGAEKRLKQHFEDRLAEHHKFLAAVPPVSRKLRDPKERTP